jgi:hypothetical protein
MIMKNLLLSTVLILATSCVSPWGQWQRAENNLKENQQQTQNLKNAEVERAAVYAHGTDIAIDKSQEAAAAITDPEERAAVQKPLQVAGTLISRTQLALPAPPIDEAVDMEQIIDDLLSENEETRERGEVALSEKDRELSVIQSQLVASEGKLLEAENKLLQIGRENARLAQKWDDLVGWVYWLVGIIIFLIVGSVVLRLLPLIFPMRGASGTLSRMVRGVEAVRQNHKIDDILRQNLDDRDRDEIAKIKRRIGLK